MIEALDWNYERGTFFKLSYDELDDWALTPHERDKETVRRIRKYEHALKCRKLDMEAA